MPKAASIIKWITCLATAPKPAPGMRWHLFIGNSRVDEIISRLSKLDSCAVSDALDKLGLAGAVTGMHRFTTTKRICGKVLTVTMGAAAGRPPSTRHLCTAAIEAAQPGDVIVVEQRTGLDAA